MKWMAIVYVSVLLVMAAQASACRSIVPTPTPFPTQEPTPIPTATPIPERKIQLYFETIEKAEFPGGRLEFYYEEREPKLVAVASQQDAAALTIGIPPQTREVISETDFESSFVLVVFQGRKPITGNEIQVGGVWQTGKVMVVKAFITESTIGGAAITSPYHVVKVSKQGMYQRGDITFVLVNYAGVELARVSHFIP